MSTFKVLTKEQLEKLEALHAAWRGEVDRGDVPQGPLAVFDSAKMELHRFIGGIMEELLTEYFAMRDKQKNYDEFKKFASEATKVITGMTIQGSEYFDKRVDDVYLADLPKCKAEIRGKLDEYVELKVRNVTQEKRIRELLKTSTEF